ncbi:MAG: acyltransferase [Myxococcales bacterium]|nr:acyltransferase [Polyangiaceae bacterium]MDW8249039.1 acyltransferase [Myxococcales bacterium]
MAVPAFFRMQLLDNRYPALHGARAIAVVMVLQLHASNLLVLHFHQPDRPLYYLSRQAWFGMDIFFLLSGFLIGTMLTHGDALSSARGIGRFYLRRAFRIFPSYYLVLTGLALMPWTTPVQRSTLAWEYIYGTNYIVFHHRQLIMPWGWSLCVEEHFYLVVPLILLLLRRLASTPKRLGVLLGIWMIGGGIRILDGLIHWNPKDPDGIFLRLFVRTHDRFDILVVGVAIALLLREHRASFEAALARRWIRTVLGLVGLVGLWLCVSPPRVLARVPTLTESLCWGTFSSLLCGALLPLLLAGDGGFKRALSAPWFRPISTLSYGIYLIHIPIGEKLAVPAALALQTTPGWTWLLSVFFLWFFSLSGAYLLHLLVEKPMLKLRARVTSG